MRSVLYAPLRLLAPGWARSPPTIDRMPFGPVDANLDLVALEEATLERWRSRDVIEETKRLRKGAEPWVFYEGPPTANGRPGLHHVWARVFKDLYPRFQTMRGHDVPRKGGWDCHGLPVEIEVEKELGLTSKHDIEAYGVAEFAQRCRDSVSRYVEDWAALTARSGVWIDTKDAYWTLSNEYIESVWWIVRQMWDKGLIYEGHRVSPYCPRCGTALASHEVAPGLQGRRRPLGLRALPARHRSRRRRPSRLDDDAVDADLERRDRGRPRGDLRAAARRRRRDATSSWRPTRCLGSSATGRTTSSPGSPGPTSKDGGTNARSPTSPLDDTRRTRRGGGVRVDRPTARASCTSLPRSVKTTPPSAGPRASPS